MKKKVLVAVSLIAAVLAVSSCTQRRELSARHINRMVKHVSRTLDLTREQKEEVSLLAEETFETLKARRSEYGDRFESARELFLKDELESEEILSAMEGYESGRKEMRAYLADQMVRFHAILTPEQREEFIDEMSKRKSERFR